MARTPRHFVLRVESFDDRCLPSVTFVETNGDLQIIGDNDANTILIQDDGTANPGNVIVVADGQSYQTVGAVDFILVQSGGGTDTVDYVLTGDLSGDRIVVADLGARADVFTAHLSDRTIAPDGRLIVQAFGDGGGDHLNLEAERINIGAKAQFQVDLVGGKAKDTLTANYVPGDVDITATVAINLQQK